MREGFFVEIQQGELGLSGERAFLQKLSYFVGWSAAHVQNSRGPAQTSRARRPGFDLLSEAPNAVAMRLRRGLHEEPEIDDFRVQRAAFQRVAHHHVHHLIIPRVTQRLREETKKKRGGKQHRMKLAPAKSLMRRLEIRVNSLKRALKFLKKIRKRRQDQPAHQTF